MRSPPTSTTTPTTSEDRKTSDRGLKQSPEPELVGRVHGCQASFITSSHDGEKEEEESFQGGRGTGSTHAQILSRTQELEHFLLRTSAITGREGGHMKSSLAWLAGWLAAAPPQAKAGFNSSPTGTGPLETTAVFEWCLLLLCF